MRREHHQATGSSLAQAPSSRCCPAPQVLIVTGVTDARTEAANTSTGQIKRTGRGYRKATHYRPRILAGAARRVA